MLDNRQYRTVTPQVRGKKGALHSPSLSVRGEFWDLGWRDGTQAGEAVSLNWGGKVGFLGWKKWLESVSAYSRGGCNAESGGPEICEFFMSLWSRTRLKIWKERKKETTTTTTKKKNPQGLREIACYGDKTFREMPNTVLNDVGVWTKQTGEILVTLVIQLRSQKDHSLGLKITP